jgi:hypothetical protein
VIPDGPDWIQGTGQEFDVQALDGEPNYFFAQCPSTKWGNDAPDLKLALMIGAAPFSTDASNLYNYQLVFDLVPDMIQNFLEGNSDGICFWGGAQPVYIIPGPGAFSLYVYTNPVSVKYGSHVKNSDLSLLIKPNPMNRNVNFQYSGAISKPRISIFNLSGRKIRTLNCNSGSSSWDGKDNTGSSVTSGTYIYRLSSGSDIIRSGRIMVNR